MDRWGIQKQIQSQMQLNPTLRSKEQPEQEKSLNSGVLSSSKKSFQSAAEGGCI